MSAFIPATAFEGPKEGHVFKMGGEGLGYYQDLGTIDVPALPPAEEQRPFTLGQRVVSEDGYFATVRYVGPVKSAKKADATFVGVEWDEPERGKHDGTVVAKDGSRDVYFKTAHPTAGSLVKPNLLMRGVTFTEALAAAEYPPSTPIHAILKTTRVDRAGTAPMSIEEERLVFINLEENLFHDLRDAMECAARCPQLLILRLGKNKFAPMSPSAPPLPLLERLNTLTLTACGLTSWHKQVACLSPSLPQLQELSLGGNPDLLQKQSLARSSSASVDEISSEIDAVKLDDGDDNLSNGQSPLLFPKLKVLEMTKCGISDWTQVEALGRACPSLTSLNLSHNSLSTLAPAFATLSTDSSPSTQPPAAAAAPVEVRAEVVLNHGGSEPLSQVSDVKLDSNKVEDWRELLALAARLPGLVSVGMMGNPAGSGLDRLRLDRAVLPLLPNLTQLDGRPITSDLRAAAESKYLEASLRAAAAKVSSSSSFFPKQQGPSSANGAASETPAGSTATGEAVGSTEAESSEAAEDANNALLANASLPTLEEFVELPGAKDAIDKVLTAEYPAYFRLAIALGHPLPYQRLLDLDNSSGPPSIEA